MKLRCFATILFTLLTVFRSKCYGQDILLKSVDAEFRVDVKQSPYVIKNEAELRNFAHLSQHIDTLISKIDFTKNCFVFVKFFHSGPSFCAKTYYEYFIQDSSRKLVLKPHIAGDHQANLYKQTLLIVPLKFISKELSQETEEKHYSSFQSHEDIQNICNYLELKFSLK